jgi:hypothetical protein
VTGASALQASRRRFIIAPGSADPAFLSTASRLTTAQFRMQRHQFNELAMQAAPSSL